MTKKFILYSSPFMFLFLCISIFEPWIYLNLVVSDKITSDLKGKKFDVIAHRGASGLAPENTLAAFQAALDLGVDMVELDVRRTSDEGIVVIHDETLDRTTNGTGPIHESTLEEVKQLDAGSWFDPKFRDEKVPTLKEVLDLVNGKCKVLIEIKKHDHPHYAKFVENLIEIIKKEKNGYDWIILESYEQEYIEAAHAYDDHVQTKKLLIGEDSTPLLAYYSESRMLLGRAKLDDRLTAINPEYNTLSTRRVFRMHASGFKVNTYLVNDPKIMVKMLNMGVDGIITDHPELLMKIKREVAAL